MDKELSTDLPHERKWFIYYQDNYHGPYSAVEVYAWVKNKAEEKPEIYLWSEDMESWELIDHTELGKVFRSQRAKFEQLAKSVDLPILWEKWDGESDISPNPLYRSHLEWHGELESSTNRPLLVDPANAISSGRKDNEIKRKVLRGGKTGLTLIVAIAATIGLLNWLESEWGQVRHPLGVQNAEYQELVRAIAHPSQDVGPRFGLAISQNSPVAPQIFITSNIPEQSQFKLQIEGIPSSLVGAFSYQRSIALLNQKGLLEVPSLSASGEAIPRGVYELSLSYNSKVYLAKTYFLGGAKDQQYFEGLKRYHQQLHQKYVDEIFEIKQVLVSQEQQVSLMNNDFERYLIALSKNQSSARQTWFQGRVQWLTYQKQLEQLMDLYGKPSAESNYFLFSFYQNIRDVGKRIIRLHAEYETFVQTGTFESKQEVKLSLEAARLLTLSAQLKERLARHEAQSSSEKLPWDELD